MAAEEAAPYAVQPLLDALALSKPPAWSGLASPLDALLGFAVGVLGVDCVGLMLLDDADEPRTVGASNQLASALEHAQVATHEGPGLETIRTGRSVAVADLAVDAHYAALWRQLPAGGVRAVLSSPVSAGDLVGNLNAARREPHVWTAAQIRANEAYAHVIGLALRLTAGVWVADRRVDRLQSLLELSGTSAEEDPL